MKNINDSLLIWKISSDIDVKNTERSKYCRFTVSITKKTENVDTGIEFKTSFVTVVAWWRLAEKVWSYEKGDNVIVQGKINVSNYETEDWTKRTSVSVTANNVDKTNNSVYGRNLNRHTIYGVTSQITEDKVKELEGWMISIKTSIATNEYIKKEWVSDSATFEDKFDTITTWTNVRIYVTKKFYQDNLERLLNQKGVPLFVEWQLLTSSWENDEGKKMYYTYLNVTEEGIINIFEKSVSKEYSSNNSEWMTEDEMKEEFNSKKSDETNSKKEVKDEEFKEPRKSRFEDDEYEEVSIEETPF